MPTTTARAGGDCPLCSLKIRPGMRIAKDFGSDVWAHIGCVVHMLRSQNTTDVAGAGVPA